MRTRTASEDRTVIVDREQSAGAARAPIAAYRTATAGAATVATCVGAAFDEDAVGVHAVRGNVATAVDRHRTASATRSAIATRCEQAKAVAAVAAAAAGTARKDSMSAQAAGGNLPIAADEVEVEGTAGPTGPTVAAVGITQGVPGAAVGAIASLAGQANARHRDGGADVRAEIADDQRRERRKSE